MNNGSYDNMIKSPACGYLAKQKKLIAVEKDSNGIMKFSLAEPREIKPEEIKKEKGSVK